MVQFGDLSARGLFVEGAICLLRALLNGLDCALLAFQNAFVRLGLTNGGGGGQVQQQRAQALDKPWVVIVGASFAGLTVQRELSRHGDELDVTVINKQSYFEYTPGILRCYVEPSYLKELTCPLREALEGDEGRKNGTVFVRGEVVGVESAVDCGVGGDGSSKNEVKLLNGQTVPFDYLVLAAGSTYEGVVKPSSDELTLPKRQAQMDRAAAELELASTVIIIGAGAVGVELAGEVLWKYPAGSANAKRVVLVDAAPTICPGFREASVGYAARWLEDNGAELMLGRPPKEIGDRSVTLADGTVIRGLVYKCFGANPNSMFLSKHGDDAASDAGNGGKASEAATTGSTLADSLKGPKGSVSVNDHLQIPGHPHIFCAGDMCHHAPTNEIKLGHTAEVNGHLVAENILRLVHSSSSRRTAAANGASSSDGGGSAAPKKLLKYPSGVVGADVTPKIYILSLGKYDATLGFNNLVVNGPVAAVMKWLIEWTKVAAAAQRPVGVLFWIVADAASNFLGRTLLRTAPKRRDSTQTLKEL